MAEWMRTPLREFASEGLAAVQESHLLPALDLRGIEDDFREGKLHWSRVWQFVTLGHWLQQSPLRNQSPSG
jgi:hypothetical protein